MTLVSAALPKAMALPWTRWGLRPQTRIRLPGWIANNWVPKGIMPLAEFEAAPQPFFFVFCLRRSHQETAGITLHRPARTAVLLLVLALSACGGRHQAAVECAPYARAVSGLQLYGDAASWWDAAEGRYPRGPTPAPCSVLVFRRSSRLPYGHVSVVTKVVTPREIEVTQANWMRGRIASHEPVVDVSPGNDWSAVRVWWGPAGQLGASVYATYGFIGASRSDRLASEPGPRQLQDTRQFQFGVAETSVPPAAARD